MLCKHGHKSISKEKLTEILKTLPDGAILSVTDGENLAVSIPGKTTCDRKQDGYVDILGEAWVRD